MYKYHNWRMLHPTNGAGGNSEGSTSTATQPGGATSEDDGEDENGDPAGEGESANIAPMTQKELDTLLNQAHARGYRKGSKETRKGDKTPEKTEDDGAGAAEAQAKVDAQALITAANQKLVSATIMAKGADMGITTKGLKVATKVIDLDDCLDAKGNVDDAAIQDELDTFIKDYSEFKRQGDKKPGFQQFEGNPKGSAQQESTISTTSKELNKHRIIK